MGEKQILNGLRNYFYNLLFASITLVCFGIITTVILIFLICKGPTLFIPYYLVVFLLCSALLSIFISGYYLWHCILNLQKYQKIIKKLSIDKHFLDNTASDDSLALYIAAEKEFYTALMTPPIQNSHELIEEQKRLLLHSQINPHFLYNTIDSIRGQALKDGFDTVANMLEAFAIMARDTFKTTEALRSLAAELESVRSYISIQQYRFFEKFSVEYDIDEKDPSVMGYLLPTLSLQPIVENAILHGIDSYEQGGKIFIQVKKTSQFLIIIIKDNGIGIDGDVLLKLNRSLRENFYLDSDRIYHSSGIALLNINARIKYYYGKEYGLHLTSLENYGTCVELLLPIGGV